MPLIDATNRREGLARGRGRIQRQIRRAFLASDRPTLSTSDLLSWTHVRHLLDARCGATIASVSALLPIS
jgi:hypothetical protein